MSTSVIVNRDEATQMIQELLQAFGPHVKIEIHRSDSAVTLRAAAEPSELLNWAEKVGTRYKTVFEKLAAS